MVEPEFVGEPVQRDHVQPGQIERVPARAQVTFVAGGIGGMHEVAGAGDPHVEQPGVVRDVVVVAGQQVYRQRAGAHRPAQQLELLIAAEIGEVTGHDHR